MHFARSHQTLSPHRLPDDSATFACINTQQYTAVGSRQAGHTYGPLGTPSWPAASHGGRSGRRQSRAVRLLLAGRVVFGTPAMTARTPTVRHVGNQSQVRVIAAGHRRRSATTAPINIDPPPGPARSDTDTDPTRTRSRYRHGTSTDTDPVQVPTRTRHGHGPGPGTDRARAPTRAWETTDSVRTRKRARKEADTGGNRHGTGGNGHGTGGNGHGTDTETVTASIGTRHGKDAARTRARIQTGTRHEFEDGTDIKPHGNGNVRARHSTAPQDTGTARHGTARHGTARHGTAPPGRSLTASVRVTRFMANAYGIGDKAKGGAGADHGPAWACEDMPRPAVTRVKRTIRHAQSHASISGVVLYLPING